MTNAIVDATSTQVRISIWIATYVATVGANAVRSVSSAIPPDRGEEHPPAAETIGERHQQERRQRAEADQPRCSPRAATR